MTAANDKSAPYARRQSRLIRVGNVPIGAGNPIVIQSMTNTRTFDAEATLSQIRALKNAGCELVRCAVLNMEDAAALREITEKSPLPVIADIHFDYKLALSAIDNGVAGLRLNPGNITEQSKVSQIAEQAALKNIPIRIGVNGGSVDRSRYAHADAYSLVQSAVKHIEILEQMQFYNLKVSLKSSDIRIMLEANRIFASERDYPLHLGVTEAGTEMMSAVRSSIGIGTLLMEGIGDTIRVSVAGDPVREIKIAREILISLGLKKGIKFIACPTCGRTGINVEQLTDTIEKEFGQLNLGLTIAVMGCTVNGPGEAKDADLAVIGGPAESLLYLRGVQHSKVKNDEILASMKVLIRNEFAVEGFKA